MTDSKNLTDEQLKKVTGDEELSQVVGGNMIEITNCPYGKTKADKSCNFVFKGEVCQYASNSDYNPSIIHIYNCDRGCGSFDDDVRDY